MTGKELNPNDLSSMLSALCDGTIDTEDFARLESRLENDPAARRWYIAYLDLHGELCWDNHSQKTSAVAIDLFPCPSFPAVELGDPGMVHLKDAASFGTFGGWALSYVVATVIICAMLLGAWAYKISHVHSDSSDIAYNQQQAPPASVFVGRITGMKDCRWSDPDTQTIVGALVLLNREYALASGLMEITYNNGARVILEGPCAYKVESTAGGYLARGKLTARIIHQGPAASEAGAKQQALFVIQTPTVSITDLGTEFGVDVDENGETTSHVFQGSVLVRAIAENRSVASAGSIDTEIVDLNVVLIEGKSVRVKCGEDDEKMQLQVDPVGWDPSSFVRTMPKSNHVGSSKAYAETLLSLHPAVYYRMERPGEKHDQTVFDFAPGGRHGKLRLGNEFGGTPYRPGRFGDALSLRGPDTRDHVIVKDYPKARENQLTVAAWVMATGRPGWAMIAANWGHPSVKGQFHLGLYQRDGDLSVSLRQSDGKQVDLREGTEQPFPLFGWQFVAFVADGDRVKLYRNGKLVASAACKGIYAETPLSGLGIGCQMNDEGTGAPVATAGYHYWQGRIDELAIFNQALSDEQIKMLFTRKQINKEPDSAAARKGGEPVDGP